MKIWSLKIHYTFHHTSTYILAHNHGNNKPNIYSIGIRYILYYTILEYNNEISSETVSFNVLLTSVYTKSEFIMVL